MGQYPVYRLRMLNEVPKTHDEVVCERKISYRSLKTAKRAARGLKLGTGQKRLHAYQCPICKLYHVGHY